MLVNYRGARSTAKRALQFRALKRLARFAVVPFGRGHLLVDMNDDEVGRTTFITGGYERIYMETATSYLNSHGREVAGKTFVDVGANIGTSTIDALLQFGFGSAVSIEPSSENHRLLRLNLVLNDLEDRVASVRVALADQPGCSTLQLSRSNSGDHRVLRSDGGPAPATSHPRQEDVECTTLDALLEDRNISARQVGLIWVDTQGHDALVLAGARLAAGAGVPIVLEYWPQGLRDHVERLEHEIRRSFSSVVDLRRLAAGVTRGTTLKVEDLAQLRDRYRGGDFTDLLLLS